MVFEIGVALRDDLAPNNSPALEVGVALKVGVAVADVGLGEGVVVTVGVVVKVGRAVTVGVVVTDGAAVADVVGVGDAVGVASGPLPARTTDQFAQLRFQGPPAPFQGSMRRCVPVVITGSPIR